MASKRLRTHWRNTYDLIDYIQTRKKSSCPIFKDSVWTSEHFQHDIQKHIANRAFSIQQACTTYPPPDISQWPSSTWTVKKLAPASKSHTPHSIHHNLDAHQYLFPKGNGAWCHSPSTEAHSDLHHLKMLDTWEARKDFCSTSHPIHQWANM